MTISSFAAAFGRDEAPPLAYTTTFRPLLIIEPTKAADNVVVLSITKEVVGLLDEFAITFTA